MSYNLLFNTDFKTTNNWHFINCKYKDGYLYSTNKIFGIEQEIILPTASKVYLRFRYSLKSIYMDKITCGIQYGDEIFISSKTPKQGANNIISVVEECNDKKIKVHLIFESTKSINRVKVDEPILCNLSSLHKSTWLKFLLDKTIKYKPGYNYQNILDYNEITPEIFNLEKAKIGSIICTDRDKQLKIFAKLIKGNKYLIKLDYKDINKLGNIDISYGILKSTKIKNQLYLIFKADNINELVINIKPNDVLPYEINLRNLLLVDITNLDLDKNDIIYLPFV